MQGFKKSENCPNQRLQSGSEVSSGWSTTVGTLFKAYPIMIPLTALTKKKQLWISSGCLRRVSQLVPRKVLVKDLLSQSSQLVIMNDEDALILYTDSSTKAIGGVLI